MRAVVIYESMYGNTRAVAEAIASGLSPMNVAVVPVGSADSATVAAADLVVVGAPTHTFGLSRPQTRSSAAQAARRSGGSLTLEPGAQGSGIREFLAAVGTCAAKAAAFDTRVKGFGVVGHAAPRIARSLSGAGCSMADRPHSFLVTKANELQPGELDRARAWGQVLAAKLETERTVSGSTRASAGG